MDDEYQLVKVTEFKEGDVICHERNLKQGFYSFFKATDDDELNYSGKNGYYYKLVNGYNLSNETSLV